MTKIYSTHALHYDNGKPDVAQVPSSLIESVAKVLMFGEHKYGRHNWRKGMEWSKLISSAVRHLLAFNSGEDLDPESGLPHLAHAATNLGFLIEYTTTCPDLDDRYKR